MLTVFIWHFHDDLVSCFIFIWMVHADWSIFILAASIHPQFSSFLGLVPESIQFHSRCPHFATHFAISSSSDSYRRDNTVAKDGIATSKNAELFQNHPWAMRGFHFPSWGTVHDKIRSFSMRKGLSEIRGYIKPFSGNLKKVLSHQKFKPEWEKRTVDHCEPNFIPRLKSEYSGHDLTRSYLKTPFNKYSDVGSSPFVLPEVELGSKIHLSDTMLTG